jgi:hypothetical protein
MIKKAEVVNKLMNFAKIYDGAVEMTPRKIFVTNSENKKISFEIKDNYISKSTAVYLVGWTQEFLRGL